MGSLEWDKVGDRVFKTGVDRGVLYPPNGPAVAWNGITGIDETPTVTTTPHYVDGVKHMDRQVPGDYTATLKAFTYPDAFEELQGVRSEARGLFFHDQTLSPFGLSYRTLIGDDVSGTERGYEIHLLYNLSATPSSASFQTLSNSPSPVEFSWTLAGTPVVFSGARPTAHVSLRSTMMDQSLLLELEERLYGSDEVDPYLPSFGELVDLIASWTNLSFVNNGDGTWTATGDRENIRMTDSSTFEIVRAPAEYLNEDTYQINTP